MTEHLQVPRCEEIGSWALVLGAKKRLEILRKYCHRAKKGLVSMCQSFCCIIRRNSWLWNRKTRRFSRNGSQPLADVIFCGMAGFSAGLGVPIHTWTSRAYRSPLAPNSRRNKDTPGYVSKSRDLFFPFSRPARSQNLGTDALFLFIYSFIYSFLRKNNTCLQSSHSCLCSHVRVPDAGVAKRRPPQTHGWRFMRGRLAPATPPPPTPGLPAPNILWTKSNSHRRIPGMIRFPCKYHQTRDAHSFKVVHDFVHPQSGPFRNHFIAVWAVLTCVLGACLSAFLEAYVFLGGKRKPMENHQHVSGFPPLETKHDFLKMCSALQMSGFALRTNYTKGSQC